MSQDRPELDRELAVQREVARIAPAGVDGFALAGSGAIREHGMIERPTEDVDLFTTSQDVTAFSTAVDQMSDQLRGSGYQVEQTRRAPQSARLHVATGDGLQLDVDLGVDWRQDEPVTLDVEPVLSLADASAARWVRCTAGARSVTTSTQSARPDGSVMISCSRRQRNVRVCPGFEVDMFVWRLDAAAHISVGDVERYAISADQLEAVKIRCRQWATDLRDPAQHAPRPGLRSRRSCATVMEQVRLSDVCDQGDPVSPQRTGRAA